MPITINHHSFDELCNEHSEIVISFTNGREIHITERGEAVYIQSPTGDKIQFKDNQDNVLQNKHGVITIKK